MNVKPGDWVKRTGYPRRIIGEQRYEDIDPHMMYRVEKVDLREGTLTIHVLKDGQYVLQEFWAGDWYKVTLTPALEGEG